MATAPCSSAAPGARRLAWVVAALCLGPLAAPAARCGSLTALDGDGSQWRAISDPADEAQGYVLEHVGRDGQFDPRFGHGGRRSLLVSATDDAPTALRVDELGRIWASGASIAGGQPQAVILRYLPDGTPDIRWGVQGKVQVAPGGLAIKPNDMLPLADGSVLVAGVAANIEPIRAVVFHLKSDGSLDLAFGQAGTWQRAGGADGSTATSLAVAGSGAVAVCVAARGDHPVAEIWSIAASAQQLLQRQPLGNGTNGDDTRVAWSGGRWVFAQGSAPNLAGLRATLDPAADAGERAAASAPSDPGQGGFSPFAQNGRAPPSMADAPADGRAFADAPATLAWVAGLIAFAAACVVALRKRSARSTTHSSKPN